MLPGVESRSDNDLSYIMRMADGLDCAQEVEPMCVVVRGTVASYSTLFLYCGFVILSFGVLFFSEPTAS